MTPQRIQRKRTEGWRMPEDTVYVGRGSKWGNPFKVGTTFFVEPGNASRGYRCINSNEDAAHLYRYWLQGRYKGHPELPPVPEGLVTLAGKNLACWCGIKAPCHADILLELANPNTKEGPAAWPGEEPETPQLTTPPRSPSLNTTPSMSGSSTRSTASSTAARHSRRLTSPIT